MQGTAPAATASRIFDSALFPLPDGPLSNWSPSPTNNRSAEDAIRGSAAIATSRVGRQVLSLCTTILLARMLTPDEFGAVAVITAFLMLGLVLQEGGLSAATIQRETVTHQAISTMFWINATVGLVLMLALAGSAPLLADFVNQPDLVPLCQATSMTFVLSGIVAQHRALLRRSMQFTTAARIELGSALVGGVCAIALAVAGFGVWALAAQMLVTDTLALLFLVRAVRWKLMRPRLTTEVRELVSFGSSMLGFSVLMTLSNNLHVVMLGRVIGTEAAGLYTRAYALASLPQNLLQTAAAHVAFPKLARAQDDETSFAAFYYRSVQLLTLVALPIALAFAIFGDQIALLVYGSAWGDAAGLLHIFAIGLALAPLLHSTGPVFLARGQPSCMLRWGVVGYSLIMLGSVAGLRWGIYGVAWGWSATTALLVLPGLLYCYRGTTLSLSGVVRTVRGIYAAGACALPLGWLARQLTAGFPMAVGFSLSFGITLIGYLALCYFLPGQKPVMRQVLDRLAPKFGRR